MIVSAMAIMIVPGGVDGRADEPLPVPIRAGAPGPGAGQAYPRAPLLRL